MKKNVWEKYKHIRLPLPKQRAQGFGTTRYDREEEKREKKRLIEDKEAIIEDVLKEGRISSMVRHCFIYKARDGQWYMELADDEYGGREDSDTYGPFDSKEQTYKYLDKFTNPGGGDEDDSGRMPVPKKSPNGNPVKKPVWNNRFSW